MAANNETGILQQEAFMPGASPEGSPFSATSPNGWERPWPRSGSRWTRSGGCNFNAGGPGRWFHQVSSPRDVLLLYSSGGLKEMNRRAGTENVAGILSMVAALGTVSSMTSDTLEERAQWRNDFENKVRRTLSRAVVFWENVPSACGIPRPF